MKNRGTGHKEWRPTARFWDGILPWEGMGWNSQRIHGCSTPGNPQGQLGSPWDHPWSTESDPKPSRIMNKPFEGYFFYPNPAHSSFSLHPSQIQGVPEAPGRQIHPGQAAPEEEGPRGPPPCCGGSEATQCHQRGQPGALSQGKATNPSSFPKKTGIFSSSPISFHPTSVGSSTFRLWRRLQNSLLGFWDGFVCSEAKIPLFRNALLQVKQKREKNLLKFRIFIA